MITERNGISNERNKQREWLKSNRIVAGQKRRAQTENTDAIQVSRNENAEILEAGCHGNDPSDIRKTRWKGGI